MTEIADVPLMPLKFLSLALFAATLPAFVAGQTNPASQTLVQPATGLDELTDPVTSEPTRTDPFSPETILNPTITGPVRESRQRQFVPAAVLPRRVPAMRLRGIGRLPDTETSKVLLEVDGFGLYVVEKGDTISLQGLATENVIRIKEVSDISIKIEVGSFGEIIVVR